MKAPQLKTSLFSHLWRTFGEHWVKLMITAMLAFVLAVPNAYSQGTVIWEDDFETYNVGQFPSTTWLPWHNCSSDPSHNIVTSERSHSGTQSLQVYGSHYGCWSATAVRQLQSLPEQFRIEANLMASGEAGSGACGHSDIGLGLIHERQASDGYGFIDVSFRDNLTVDVGVRGVGRFTLRNYETGQWYNVALEIDTVLRSVSVFIDGEQFGPYVWSDSDLPYPLDEYRSVAIGAADGKGWADDLFVTEGLISDGWCDGFENYASGSSVGSSWSLSGNNSSVADNSIAFSGSQSLKMFGSIGSCWAAVADKPLEATYPLTVEFAVRNGTENLYGCHPNRATVALRNGDHWTDPGSVGILGFAENGDLFITGTYPYDTLSGYSLEQWYHFKVDISVPGDGYVHLSYWVDGNYIGEYTRDVSELPNLMNATHLDLAAQEGTVWFDDVCVIPGTTTSPVFVDIKPGSWPNPINLKSKGKPTFVESGRGVDTELAAKSDDGIRRARAVIPAAVLGTGDFDISEIDPQSISLLGVAPDRWSYEDVSSPTPGDPAACEGHEGAPDGFLDLTLKFPRDAIVETLGEVYDGEQIPVTITGTLLGGTPFEGVDCFLVVNGESPPLTNQGGLNLRNYPNPFNPTTQISFTLPKASDVKLQIYNMLGQIVEIVIDRQLEAGTHTYSWDGSSAASGIYLYRLTAGDFVETKKMILLK